MADDARNTIYAVSTALGRAAIAVVRISGLGARDALQAIAGEPLPLPRTATVRQLKSAPGDIIDQALVLWFPATQSATGEDVAEFHLHGGRAIQDAVLRALAGVPGL